MSISEVSGGQPAASSPPPQAAPAARKHVEVSVPKVDLAPIPKAEIKVDVEKLKAQLQDLNITGAKELDVNSGKKVIVVYVPVSQLAQFQKIIKEKGLVEELEKKFSGKQVVIVAERRIIRRENRNSRQLKQPRPRSRTLTAVHEAVLDELVFPTEIVGKRLRVRLDGSRLLKVLLNPEAKLAGDKLDGFSRIYKSLTGKDVTFEVPSA